MEHGCGPFLSAFDAHVPSLTIPNIDSPLTGLIFPADGCTNAPAGVNPPASLPLPSSNSDPTIHTSFLSLRSWAYPHET